MIEVADRLDSLDRNERMTALREVAASLEEGTVTRSGRVNMHVHSFFSYNYRFFSPSRVVYEAFLRHLDCVCVVDFDVLDGVEETIDAGLLLRVPACAGMETRVFVPWMEDVEINSPGEPGIAYFIGAGFPDGSAAGSAVLKGLAEIAHERLRGMVERLNAALQRITVDVDSDVLPLTPAGNATERHLSLAYVRKAREVFGVEGALAFWSEVLGEDFTSLEDACDVRLQNAVRSKLMKRGGPGYVPPGKGSFPLLDEVVEFVEQAGAVPVYAWLDGFSDGERDPESLLVRMVERGVCGVNIIPARNYTPGAGISDERCAAMYELVLTARKRGLFVVAGTEMNSPGQPFVDDFDSIELAPLAGVFLQGARVLYAHTMLRRFCGIGYTGAWAERHLGALGTRRSFFEEVGEALVRVGPGVLEGLSPSSTPAEVMRRLK